MIDYTDLDYKTAICPNCGKLLKITYHDDGPSCLDDYDEYHGFDNTWGVCRCKDCKISGDGSRAVDYKLSSIDAWKFPKDYKITATQKQNNYLRFLARETGLHYNFIANKEVASQIIKQYLEVYIKIIKDNLYEDKIKDCFLDLDFTCYNFFRDLKNELSFYKDYTTNTETIFKVVITVNLDTKQFGFTISSENQIDTDLQDFASVFKRIDDDIEYLKSEFFNLSYPTNDEASKKIQEDATAYRDNLKYLYRNNEYDYFDCSYDLNA